MGILDNIQTVLWILGPLGQAITAVIMFRRNLIREVPWFFAYTLFHILHFLVLFTAYHLSYRVYFYGYWAGEAIDAILVLVVIQEVYAHAFRPFEALRNLGTILFRWATIVLLAISLLVAWNASGSEQNRFIAALLILDRSASFVQIGVIFLLAVLKQVLALPWGNPSRGIALGLGLVSTSFAVNLTLRAYSHASLDVVFGLILTLTYNVAVVLWIVTVLSVRTMPIRGDGLPTDMLRSWNSALLELNRK